MLRTDFRVSAWGSLLTRLVGCKPSAFPATLSVQPLSLDSLSSCQHESPDSDLLCGIWFGAALGGAQKYSWFCAQGSLLPVPQGTCIMPGIMSASVEALSEGLTPWTIFLALFFL